MKACSRVTAQQQDDQGLGSHGREMLGYEGYLCDGYLDAACFESEDE